MWTTKNPPFVSGRVHQHVLRNPPVCLENSSQPVSEEIEATCLEIHDYVFGGLDHEAIFNETVRLDFLRTIPDSDPICSKYREAYPQCFWCKGPDSMCFAETTPPTCTKPEKERRQTNDTLVAGFCSAIHTSLFYSLQKMDHIYDLAQHAKYLALSEGSAICDFARDYYHLCSFCDEIVIEYECLTTFPCEQKRPIPKSATAATMSRCSRILILRCCSFQFRQRLSNRDCWLQAEQWEILWVIASQMSLGSRSP